MVRKVGVHDNHKVAADEFEAVDIRSPKAQLACARLQNLPAMSSDFSYIRAATHDFVLSIYRSQLPRNFLRSIGTSVVHYDDFPCKVTGVVSAAWFGKVDTTYFSLKVFASSQMMMGRFLRSL